MKKIVSSFFVAGLCLLGLIGCGNSQSADGEMQPKIIRLTHCQADGHPIDEGADLFAELVHERTNGRLEVQVFPANMLGPESVTRDMVKEGSVDMVLLGSAANNYNGAQDLASCFYLMRSIEECDYMFLDSDWAKKYLYPDYLENNHVVYLDSWSQSPRQTMATKEFTTPEELSSIKLRMPAGIPMWERGYSLMGAMTVTLGLDDAFSGLQQGVCDGVEGPIDQLSFYSFQEVAKNLILTNHNYYSYQALMNEKSFNSLSEEDQQIIRESIVEAGKHAGELRDQLTESIVEDMKAAGVNVITLTDEQLDVFAQKALQVVEENMDRWGQECYDEFVAELDEFRAAHK